MTPTAQGTKPDHNGRGWRLLRTPGGIRGRVTASATLIVALTLILAGVALSFLVHHSLVTGLDGNLSSRAQSVLAQITANGYIHGAIASPAKQGSLAQVLDAKGTVIAATADIQGEDPVMLAPPSPRRSATFTLTDSPLDSGGSFRVLAEPVHLKDGPGWIYVAASLAPVNAATLSVATLFTIGLPLVLLVVAFIVWRAAGQALKPVNRIRKQASAIGGADLTQRVLVPGSRDEIAKLAVTMNHMLDRLEASANRQNQFIGDASHELRSPLAALHAQVEVALDHPDHTEATRVLGIVQEQVTRMTILTEDLLFLARSTEDGPMVLPALVDLDELVLAEVHRLREFGDHTITLSSLDAVRVSGSRRDLTRALRNLTDNARNHAHLEIRIAIAVLNDVAEITVSDDGAGIASADLEKLFERFTRLDDARTRNLSGGGFGLGLAIARQIVIAHRGSLTASDRADGHPGAEFRLRLPLAPV